MGMALPSLRGLSLDRLSSFLQVADAGGLARAAPGEPVRQSQLSRQLKELETALEQSLFVRTGRGMELTPAGAALARVVRELGQGLTDVAAAERGPVRVSLGAGDSVLQWLVLPRLGELGTALADVELEVGALGSDGVVNALLEHRVDLGLLRGSEAAGELQRIKLGQVTYALFSAAGKGKLPLAVPSTERGLVRALGKLERAALHCETFPQVAQAVRSGCFTGVLPTFARAQLPAAEFRMTSHPALDSAATPLLLAWRARTLELRPQVKVLRRALEVVVKRALK
ncbi:MAG: LysR family transcriptional regulator [Archangium sp.]|nr:LysR family transcriptional regulator [Archangium sp.]